MEPIKRRNIASIIFACAADLSNLMGPEYHVKYFVEEIVKLCLFHEEDRDQIFQEIDNLIEINKNKVKFPL